ncbi:MAG: ABC transporter ATP-binding protein [Candidatus Hadarchaeota archaeon]
MKLEVRGVNFSYGDKPVLRDIDFRLSEGEVLGIVGPNAAGKTTLLKCLNGSLKPDDGAVIIDDKELSKLSREDIAKRIGYVPQIKTELFPVTVFDSVLMGRRPRGGWKPNKEDLERTSAVLRRLELGEISDRGINEISGGQRQKVALARAIAQEPDVLILDEPTNNLDLRHQVDMLNAVRNQASKRTSTIMAIHDLSLVGRYSDSVIILDGGEILAKGGKEILTKENIEKAFNVRVRVEEGSGGPIVIPEKPI